MDFKNGRTRIVVWIISIVIILVGTYCWTSFKLNLNFVLFWLIGIILSFAIVFVLQKVVKLWKVPIIIIGLSLIYHLYSAISLYSFFNDSSISLKSFLSSLKYTYGGELRMVFVLTEIPFIILTILYTIGFYIFGRIKSEMDID